MKLIQKIFNKYNQLVIYLIIGGFSAGIDYLFFSILTHSFNMLYLIANIYSIHIGIITSFILNRKFNFKIKDKIMTRFLSFYLIGLFGLIISTGLLFILIEGLSYNKPLAKILSIIVIALIQFSLNKFITFKREN
jgi:putative flippase GtrA